MLARHLFVSGRVQGVGFRWSTAAEGERLGLAGWVRNLADGRVEAWCEGEDAAVEAFVAWCRRGPTGARVAELDVREGQPRGERGFRIRRDVSG